MKKLLIALTGIVAAMGIVFSANTAIVSQAKGAPEFMAAMEGTNNDLDEIVIALYRDDTNEYAYVTDYVDTTYGVCSDTYVNHNGVRAEQIRVNGFIFYFYEYKGMNIIELEDGSMYACEEASADRIAEIRSIMG